MPNREVSVIRLADADVNEPESVRALLADALSSPRARVLADLTGLRELHGPLIAAMLIAVGELGPEGRFAVYAPVHILEQMNNWHIAENWVCFGDWDLATAYLCAEPA